MSEKNLAASSWRAGRSVLAGLALAALASTAHAQVTVINMVPNARSNETNQDSEPNLAVNPANPQQIAGSAFTPATAGTSAPIYVSTNNGTLWSLNNIVPGNGAVGTKDITLRFGGTSNFLYAGILRGDLAGTVLNILRTPNFTAAPVMSILLNRASDDQPYVQATTVLGGAGVGQDKLYVGDNDLAAPAGKTATVDFSQSAAVAVPAFGLTRVEKRTTAGQDAPSIRPIWHYDGTVYAVFFRWTSIVPDPVIPNKYAMTSDVVVVRDDAWAAGANPFTALVDPDTFAGKKVVTGINVPFDNNPSFGQERRGSSLSIAVDPRNSSRVYIAWADGTATTYNLHVRRSDNRGVTWTGDIRTINGATNPTLAVNTNGKVGFLYQQLTGSGATARWETHLQRSADLGATWTDMTLARPLANAPAAVFLPYLGDYIHLQAVGKDFYGIFSASNKPDAANFPQGVTYQRNVDWTAQTLRNLANTGTVAVSIDPFFFKVTELSPANDFYVRDWTDSPTSGDSGLEPSTHPVFYATSDVWNRRGTLPGTFVNDQPPSEPAGNGAGIIGDNWAFARIRRNAVSAGSQTVTAHFLVSKFGTGSSYVDATVFDPSVTFFGPDPTVTFLAGDLGPKITPAYHWHLNAISGNHLCLAVEISTPSDPYVAPSLRGYTPGWPVTDLRVILDNNKAQRNLGLSTTPARGVGHAAVRTTATDLAAGWSDYYGIAHNAATIPRDMQLHYSVDPKTYERFAGGTIEVLGQGPVPLAQEGDLTIPGVQPGENRWIQVSVPAVSGTAGEVLTVDFQEIVLDQAIDGFSIGTQIAATEDTAGAVVELHRSVYTRIGAWLGSDTAQAEADAAQQLAGGGPVAGEKYAEFLVQHLPAMGDVLQSISALLADDPFANQAAFETLSRLAAGSKDADLLSVAHASFLNRLDSLLTQRQLELGDRADSLQMVRWMKDLYLRVPRLADLGPAGAIVDASRAFVIAWDERKADYVDYPKLLQSLSGPLLDSAKDLEGDLPGLTGDVNTLQAALASGDLNAIEKAHRDFLLRVQTLEPPESSPAPSE
jgi:hypothetical protein